MHADLGVANNLSMILSYNYDRRHCNRPDNRGPKRFLEYFIGCASAAR